MILPQGAPFLDTQNGNAQVTAYQTETSGGFPPGPDIQKRGSQYCVWNGATWTALAPGDWVVGTGKVGVGHTNTAFGSRFTPVPVLTPLLQTIATNCLNATHGTFGDGVEYWIAAPSYLNPFVADMYLSMEGYPEFFTATQVKNWADKVVARRDGSGNFPGWLDANASGFFYSGCDNLHNRTLGDGNLLIPMAYKLHYDKSGSIAAFDAVKTLLKAALNNIPLNEVTKLVTVSDTAPWVPWGFNDNAKHTGDVLFGSLLYYQAAVAMSALYTVAGDAADASLFAGRAADIATNLATLWNAGAGMYNAATIKNAQIDILGSAFALFLNIPDAAKKTAISTYLVNNYTALTRRGYVRQSPTAWVTPWNCAQYVANNIYDNGYWSVGNRWVATALAHTSPAAARQLITDYLSHPDPTLEWIGAGQGATTNLASPMGALRFARDHNL